MWKVEVGALCVEVFLKDTKVFFCGRTLVSSREQIVQEPCPWSLFWLFAFEMSSLPPMSTSTVHSRP